MPPHKNTVSVNKVSLIELRVFFGRFQRGMRRSFNKQADVRFLSRARKTGICYELVIVDNHFFVPRPRCPRHLWRSMLFEEEKKSRRDHEEQK